jgi:hypothetical protein
MTDFDLVNWTMQEARQLGPEHHMHDEIKSAPTLEKLFEVLDGHRLRNVHPSNDQPRSDQPRNDQPRLTPLDARHGSDGSDQSKGSGLTANPTREAAANLPIVTAAELPIPAGPTPISPRLKAIIEPDIYTAPSDRARAIILRWVLRDIRANRLKLSPVNQRDLRELIELGLVEMAADAPILTNAGVKAIR